MPYDALCWGETEAKTGLTATTSRGPAPTVFTGDINILKKGIGTPYLVGLGSTGITKPGGCAVAGNRSYGTNKFCGPGHLMFGSNLGFRTQIAAPFQEGESITGYGENTAVAEYIVIQADFTYGSPHRRPDDPWEAMAAAGGGELWCVPTSCTAAAIITPALIGTLDALTTDTGDMWLDTRANYHILGYESCVGIASSSGTILFTALSGSWNGHIPGLPASSKDAVQLGVGGATMAYEPIPFAGDALPGYMYNAVDDVANLGALYLAKHA